MLYFRIQNASDIANLDAFIEDAAREVNQTAMNILSNATKYDVSSMVELNASTTTVKPTAITIVMTNVTTPPTTNAVCSIHLSNSISNWSKSMKNLFRPIRRAQRRQNGMAAKLRNHQTGEWSSTACAYHCASSACLSSRV